MKNCQRCRLRAGCTQVVEGRGPKDSQLMIVGEAPGATEDADGIAFVGRSGKLLDKLLRELGLANNVYITNAVKCRPPNNRRPQSDEIASCRQWLEQELLDVYQVVALGRTAQDAIAGRDWEWGTDLIVCVAGGRHVACRAAWHPSFILRNPQLYEKWKEQWTNLKP